MHWSDDPAKASPGTTQTSRRTGTRGNAARIAPWKWKPGQSGNPSGRRKDDWAREIAQAVFEKNPEALYQAMCRAVLRGNAYAFKELADRAYGKVKELHEVTGKDGGPMLHDMTSDQLDRRIAELMRKLGLKADK